MAEYIFDINEALYNEETGEAVMKPEIKGELIRCKDCKYLFDGEHNANCCELLMRKAKWLIEITVDMNWYCADGERRTDAKK